jgi:hypothetical protein
LIFADYFPLRRHFLSIRSMLRHLRDGAPRGATRSLIFHFAIFH